MSISLRRGKRFDGRSNEPSRLPVMAPNDSGSITEQLAGRVRELLQGAEEQAKKVMEDAEAEVKRIRESAAEQGHRLIEDARKALDDLEGRLEPGEAPAPPKPPAGAPPPPPVPPKPEPEKAPEPDQEEPEPLPVPEAVTADPEPAKTSAGGGDEAAARLVAMKLALDGTSRDDVRAKLEADYSVVDMDGLLDDVFAKAGK
jgi:outer membrane biosynthesis protein TonB